MKITKDVHECDYKILKLFKDVKIFYKICCTIVQKKKKIDNIVHKLGLFCYIGN
jgi:hypothetical protein